MPKIRINLSVDKEIYKKFKKYCEERGMVSSKKVELFMKEVLKKAK